MKKVILSLILALGVAVPLSAQVTSIKGGASNNLADVTTRKAVKVEGAVSGEPVAVAITTGGTTTTPSYVRIQDGDSTTLADVGSTAATAINSATSAVTVNSHLRVWDGTNWQAAREATAATGTTGTGVPGTALLAFDATNYRRLRTNLADAEDGVSTLFTAPTIFNGATFDRMRATNIATGTTGTGLLGAGILGWDGTNYQRLSTVGDAQGTNGARLFAVGALGFDGTNYQRLRTNTADAENNQNTLTVLGNLYNGSSHDRMRSIDGAASTGLGTLAVAQAPNVEAGAAVSVYNSTSGLGSTVQSVKTSAGNLYGWNLYNGAATSCVIQVFDLASAGSVTLGTTVPDFIIPMATTANKDMPPMTALKNFANGIQVASTTTTAGLTACTVTTVGTIFFK